MLTLVIVELYSPKSFDLKLDNGEMFHTLSTDCITLFRSSLVRLRVSALPDLDDILMNSRQKNFYYKKKLGSICFDVKVNLNRLLLAKLARLPNDSNVVVHFNSLATDLLITQQSNIYVYYCHTSYIPIQSIHNNNC